MITFFIRKFVKNHKEIQDPKVRQSYGVLCAIVGICLNVLLFAGKILAGIISKSIAITADAFNNLSDAGSSVVTLVGFKIAGTEPDMDHPFGHGRMEYISGLVVSGVILLMAYELVMSSIDKILHPQEVTYSAIALVILVISILVKLYMCFYNRRIGKKVNSASMKATATDSFSDAIATTVVLIAALVGRFTDLAIDGYCGVLVGLFIFYAGINAAKETLNPLLGQPPEEEFVKKIEELVMSYDEVSGIHDLIVHDYGPGRRMISLHAEVSEEGNILELHDTIDNIEKELSRELKCDAVIHMDPIATHNQNVLEIRKAVQECLNQMDEHLSMHDFRMVVGKSHTNLIFDVVVPYGYSLTDDEVREKIRELVSVHLGENYYCVIDVDKKYIA